jgi:hypothetical protein
MSMYRKEWDCCGDVSETNGWEPDACPFCPASPSPSTAPEVDERAAAFEEAARIAASFGPGRPLVERRPNDLIRGRWEGEQAASANISRMLLERAALTSRPAEVDDEAARLRKVLVEVRHALQFANDSPGGGISDTLWMMHGPETVFDFIDAALAEQYRQGQRDAVAADRARRGEVDPWTKKTIEFLAARIAQKVATNCGSVPNLTFPHIYLELCDVLLAAPSHTTNKENGGADGNVFDR